MVAKFGHPTDTRTNPASLVSTYFPRKAEKMVVPKGPNISRVYETRKDDWLESRSSIYIYMYIYIYYIEAPGDHQLLQMCENLLDTLTRWVSHSYQS